MAVHPHKLGVIGLGHVGSAVLADAMGSGLFGEIVVIDSDANVALGEALDQHHSTGVFTRTNTTVVSGSYEDLADADVVIIAAGPSMIPNPDDPDGQPDRAALSPVNAGVIREVMGKLSAVTREPVVIVITNPCDTMTFIAATEFGFPTGRVFGTGTMLDSARMRRLVADRHDISPLSVEGFMIGEHGLSAVPALSLVRVGGIPNDRLGDVFGGTPYEVDDLAADVVDAAYKVFRAKGWTNAGVAQSAVAMARAVVLNERSVHPAATPLTGEYGIDDVALSLPCVIGENGVEARIAPPLSPREEELLQESAAAIRQAMRDAKAGRFAEGA